MLIFLLKFKSSLNILDFIYADSTIFAMSLIVDT